MLIDYEGLELGQCYPATEDFEETWDVRDFNGHRVMTGTLSECEDCISEYMTAHVLALQSEIADMQKEPL